MDLKIALLQEKLEQLRERDKGFTIFGSSNHQYIMNRCLSEAEIQAFEKKHKIELPIDYRSFLLHIGNGGAGPGYLMYKLDHYWGYRHNEEKAQKRPDFLSSPFKHTTPWNMSREPVVTKAMTHLEFNREYFKPAYIQGSIMIAFYGCTTEARLVITGTEYGNIWIDNRGADLGVYPVTPPESPLTFSEATLTFAETSPSHVDFFTWYNRWLDDSLTKVEQTTQP